MAAERALLAVEGAEETSSAGELPPYALHGSLVPSRVIGACLGVAVLVVGAAFVHSSPAVSRGAALDDITGANDWNVKKNDGEAGKAVKFHIYVKPGDTGTARTFNLKAYQDLRNLLAKRQAAEGGGTGGGTGGGGGGGGTGGVPVFVPYVPSVPVTEPDAGADSSEDPYSAAVPNYKEFGSRFSDITAGRSPGQIMHVDAIVRSVGGPPAGTDPSISALHEWYANSATAQERADYSRSTDRMWSGLAR